MTRARLVPGDGDPRHGSYNAYANLKCRCKPCRAANTAEHKRLRQVRKARIDADPGIATHGAESTYFNYGCRCEPCRAAHRVEDARRRAARYEAATLQARGGL